MGDVGGARVGDCAGVVGIGLAVACGVGAGSLPPQAETTKVSPTIIRNKVDDGLPIGPIAKRS